jgi:hypothetical protein
MLFYVNLVLVFLSGYLAYREYTRGNTGIGHFNLVASAMNLAAVLHHILA